jgi:hypothetical protein
VVKILKKRPFQAEEVRRSSKEVICGRGGIRTVHQCGVDEGKTTVIAPSKP